MSIYTPEPFRELEVCPTNTHLYRKPQIPADPPISMGSPRCAHHHPQERLEKRRVEPLRNRRGPAPTVFSRVLVILAREARWWTPRAISEVMGDITPDNVGACLSQHRGDKRLVYRQIPGAKGRRFEWSLAKHNLEVLP